MEALAVFSVACNVMQTIQFGFETVKLCRDIYGNKSPAPDLKYRQHGLRGAVELLQKSIVSAPSTPLENEERQLQQVVRDLVHTANELAIELQKCGMGSNPSLLKALGKAAKYALRSKAKLEKLNASLQASQSVMETRILISLRIELIYTTTQNGQVVVDRQLQDFLQHLRDGHLTLAHLIDTKSGQVKEVVREEGNITRVHLDAHSEQIQNAVAAGTADTNRHIGLASDSRQSKQAQSAQREQLIRSLDCPEMAARRNAPAINHSHEGTFRWIFEEQGRWSSFTNWLASDDKIYWVSGKPGSGKSSLVRYLVTQCRTKTSLQRWHANAIIMSAFIWSAGSPWQRSQVALLATLLQQLVLADHLALEHLQDKVQTFNKRTLSDWTKSELLDCFRRTLEDLARPTCIFIDGLDEIDPNDYRGHLGLLDLIDKLKTLPHLKLCLGSREDQPYVDTLSKYPRLRLQDLTEGDMQQYVRDELCLLNESIVPDLTKERLGHLQDILVSKANGVFLWLRLVIQSIQRGGAFAADDYSALLEKVERLPTELSEFYKSMWARLNKDDKQAHRAESALYFRLLTDDVPSTLSGKASRPLSLFELCFCSDKTLQRAFLSGGSNLTAGILVKLFDSLKRKIHYRCAGLVEISGPSLTEEDAPGHFLVAGKVDLIHRSVRDFLTDSLDGQMILQYEQRTTAELCFWRILAVIPVSAFLSHNDVDGHDESFSGLRSTMNLIGDACALSPSLELQVFDLVTSALARSADWEKMVDDTLLVRFAASVGAIRYVKRYMQSFSTGLPLGRLRESSDLLTWSSINWDSHSIPSVSSRLSSLMTWLLTAENADPNLLPAIRDNRWQSPSHTPFIAFCLLLNQMLKEHPLQLSTGSFDKERWEQTFGVLYTLLNHGANVKTRCTVIYSYYKGCFQGEEIIQGVLAPYWVKSPTSAEFYPRSGCHMFLAELDAADIFRNNYEQLHDAIDELPSKPQQDCLRNFFDRKHINPPKVALQITVHDVQDADPSLGNGQLYITSTTKSTMSKYLHLHMDCHDGDDSVKPTMDRCQTPEDMNGEETVAWLVEHGYISKQFASSCVSPVDILYCPHKTHSKASYFTPFSKMDWSYKPEYDNLLAAMQKEGFGVRENA